MDDEASHKPNPNPRETANLFSVLFFIYTLDMFKTGSRREITAADLYQVLNEDRSKKLGDELEMEWEKELRKVKPSLFRAICRMFGRKYFLFCCVVMFLHGLRLSQPIVLYYTLMCFLPEDNGYTISHAYIYVTCIWVLSLLFVMTSHSYAMGLQHMGMKIRVACCSLIFRKSLRLGMRAMTTTTVGQMVNLLSNDVSRFDTATLNLPYLCTFPAEIGVMLYLIYIYIGWVPYAGTAVMFLVLPTLLVFGIWIAIIRGRTSVRTDERVRLMGEIIAGIKVIKMYVWEQPFSDLVAKARRLEIKQILLMGYIKAMIVSMSLYMAKFAVFISLAIYVYSGHVPAAIFVFIMVSFFNVLRQDVTIYFPYIIAQISEASISIKRLRKFLLLEEYSRQLGYFKRESVGITINNMSTKWDLESVENTIEDFTLSVDSNEMIAVIGAVGSGKTSLLCAILGELQVMEGTLNVNGEISYATQEAWFFCSSIRQNILFGEEYDSERYNEVVEACALTRDFSLLPFGDRTLIGDRGVTLSGGQKARISLARAVYKDADIYLLDDPLSAVDTQSGKHIFNECITGYLKGKCTILVTHQIQYLKSLPRIVMLENGQLFFDGDFAELTKAAERFTKSLETDTDDQLIDTNKPKTEGWPSTELPEPVEITESKLTGGIKTAIYCAYVRAGGNCCTITLLILLFLISQMVSSGSDYYLAIWVGTNKGNSTEAINVNVVTYSCLIMAVAITSLLRSMCFHRFAMNASINLHNNMFDRIVRAPMPFFNQTPTGVILNRFSKDMGAMDDILPLVALDSLQIALHVIGVLVLTLLVDPFIIIPISIMAIVFYIFKIFYLRTSRDIKRLEGTTRSPVFTHLNTCLQGLMTIRAFGAEEMLIKEFDRLQDIHSSVWHTFLATTRAFGFVLDIICALYLACVCYIMVICYEGKKAGEVGLVITQTLTLTLVCQWGMRQWSEMQNQMTSVERVVEYSNLTTETTLLEPVEVSSEWPSEGKIEFKHVSLKYSDSERLVLQDINFIVMPREKIGIVGRTGAGKSSLIGSIFQLIRITGQILIDDIDIRTVPLDTLRLRIAIIPQEPVLFMVSLRKNLDPFDEYSDESIWHALEEVMLKDTIELSNGLDTLVSEGGSNYSIGQRQLLCLARAILKKNNIMIMDEATANVDPYTDFLIQNTIREKFVECTVLTIAHRLDTIIDSDKLLVIDEGQCKEFDHPYILLNNPESLFYATVQNTGKTMAEALTKLAKQSYETKELLKEINKTSKL